jgi:hypothetical protein
MPSRIVENVPGRSDRTIASAKNGALTTNGMPASAAATGNTTARPRARNMATTAPARATWNSSAHTTGRSSAVT